MAALVRLGATAVLLVAALAACASGGSGHNGGSAPIAPSTGSGTPPDPDRASCPSAPSSTGPLAGLARLTISGPPSASAGEQVRVSASVGAGTAAPRMITTPATSAVLLLSGDRVVGRSSSEPGGAGIPLTLAAGTAQRAQAVPGTVRLSACDGGPLSAGQYALVAVLGYRIDPLNAAPDGALAPPTGSRGFHLVSQPATLAVR